MITDVDIKKMKAVFATKKDLKQLSDKFEAKFVTKEDLKIALGENSQILVRDIIDLFDSTNERIDKFLDRTETNEDELQDHENRLRKVEDKVFVI